MRDSTNGRSNNITILTSSAQKYYVIAGEFHTRKISRLTRIGAEYGHLWDGRTEGRSQPIVLPIWWRRPFSSPLDDHRDNSICPSLSPFFGNTVILASFPLPASPRLNRLWNSHTLSKNPFPPLTFSPLQKSLRHSYLSFPSRDGYQWPGGRNVASLPPVVLSNNQPSDCVQLSGGEES